MSPAVSPRLTYFISTNSDDEYKCVAQLQDSMMSQILMFSSWLNISAVHNLNHNSYPGDFDPVTLLLLSLHDLHTHFHFKDRRDETES